MSRRRDRRRKRHQPNFHQTPLPARSQNQTPAVVYSQKWIVVLFVALLLGVAGLVWQLRRPKPPESFETTALNAAAPATNANKGTTVEPGNSIPLLTSNLTGSPNSPTNSDQAAIKLNRQANQLMTGGDVQGAIRLYEKALRITPEDEDLHYNLGIAYAKAGDFSKAEAHYRDALRLLPDYAEVHNNLGNLLLRTGRWNEAAEELTEAIKLQPEYAAAYNNLGIVRQKQKRLEEAIEYFQKAVGYDTNYLEAHFNLATASLLARNQAKAISEFREVLRLDPTFEAAQRGLAKAMQK